MERSAEISLTKCPLSDSGFFVIEVINDTFSISIANPNLKAPFWFSKDVNV